MELRSKSKSQAPQCLPPCDEDVQLPTGEHVQFVLLPLFGEPGTDASKSKFGDVCELLKSGFTDPYGEIELLAYRGRKTAVRSQEARLQACQVAGLWLGGKLVCATLLRTNLPGKSGALHTMILYQATAKGEQRRGLGSLMTHCTLRAAANAGYKAATVAVSGKAGRAFWAKQGFDDRHNASTQEMHITEASRAHAMAGCKVWMTWLTREQQQQQRGACPDEAELDQEEGHAGAQPAAKDWSHMVQEAARRVRPPAKSAKAGRGQAAAAMAPAGAPAEAPQPKARGRPPAASKEKATAGQPGAAAAAAGAAGSAGGADTLPAGARGGARAEEEQPVPPTPVAAEPPDAGAPAAAAAAAQPRAGEAAPCNAARPRDETATVPNAAAANAAAVVAAFRNRGLPRPAGGPAGGECIRQQTAARAAAECVPPCATAAAGAAPAAAPAAPSGRAALAELPPNQLLRASNMAVPRKDRSKDKAPSVGPPPKPAPTPVLATPAAAPAAVGGAATGARQVRQVERGEQQEREQGQAEGPRRAAQGEDQPAAAAAAAAALPGRPALAVMPTNQALRALNNVKVIKRKDRARDKAPPNVEDAAGPSAVPAAAGPRTTVLPVPASPAQIRAPAPAQAPAVPAPAAIPRTERAQVSPRDRAGGQVGQEQQAADPTAQQEALRRPPAAPPLAGGAAEAQRARAAERQGVGSTGGTPAAVQGRKGGQQHAAEDGRGVPTPRSPLPPQQRAAEGQVQPSPSPLQPPSPLSPPRGRSPQRSPQGQQRQQQPPGRAGSEHNHREEQRAACQTPGRVRQPVQGDREVDRPAWRTPGRQPAQPQQQQHAGARATANQGDREVERPAWRTPGRKPAQQKQQQQAAGACAIANQGDREVDRPAWRTPGRQPVQRQQQAEPRAVSAVRTDERKLQAAPRTPGQVRQPVQPQQAEPRAANADDSNKDGDRAARRTPGFHQVQRQQQQQLQRAGTRGANINVNDGEDIRTAHHTPERGRQQAATRSRSSRAESEQQEVTLGRGRRKSMPPSWMRDGTFYVGAACKAAFRLAGLLEPRVDVEAGSGRTEGTPSRRRRASFGGGAATAAQLPVPRRRAKSLAPRKAPAYEYLEEQEEGPAGVRAWGDAAARAEQQRQQDRQEQQQQQQDEGAAPPSPAAARFSATSPGPRASNDRVEWEEVPERFTVHLAGTPPPRPSKGAKAGEQPQPQQPAVRLGSRGEEHEQPHPPAAQLRQQQQDQQQQQQDPSAAARPYAPVLLEQERPGCSVGVEAPAGGEAAAGGGGGEAALPVRPALRRRDRDPQKRGWRRVTFHGSVTGHGHVSPAAVRDGGQLGVQEQARGRGDGGSDATWFAEGVLQHRVERRRWRQQGLEACPEGAEVAGVKAEDGGAEAPAALPRKRRLSDGIGYPVLLGGGVEGATWNSLGFAVQDGAAKRARRAEGGGGGVAVLHAQPAGGEEAESPPAAPGSAVPTPVAWVDTPARARDTRAAATTTTTTAAPGAAAAAATTSTVSPQAAFAVPALSGGDSGVSTRSTAATAGGLAAPTAPAAAAQAAVAPGAQGAPPRARGASPTDPVAAADATLHLSPPAPVDHAHTGTPSRTSTQQQRAVAQPAGSTASDELESTGRVPAVTRGGHGAQPAPLDASPAGPSSSAASSASASATAQQAAAEARQEQMGPDADQAGSGCPDPVCDLLSSHPPSLSVFQLLPGGVQEAVRNSVRQLEAAGAALRLQEESILAMEEAAQRAAAASSSGAGAGTSADWASAAAVAAALDAAEEELDMCGSVLRSVTASQRLPYMLAGVEAAVRLAKGAAGGDLGLGLGVDGSAGTYAEGGGRGEAGGYLPPVVLDAVAEARRELASAAELMSAQRQGLVSVLKATAGWESRAAGVVGAGCTAAAAALDAGAGRLGRLGPALRSSAAQLRVPYVLGAVEAAFRQASAAAAAGHS